MRALFRVSAWLAAGLAMAAAMPAAESPTLRLDGERVVASGVTSGSDVVVIGIGRRLDGSISYLLHRASRESDHDGDGVVTIDSGWNGSPYAVWAMVDLTSGAHASVKSDSTVTAALALPEDAMAAPAIGESTGKPTSLRLDGRRCHALLVRPGVGAWQGTVADGSASDGDRQGNGSLELAIAGLEPVGLGEVSPLAFESRDVLVLIDPDTLQMATTTVADLLFEERDDAKR